jgi:hypothetical protein
MQLVQIAPPPTRPGRGKTSAATSHNNAALGDYAGGVFEPTLLASLFESSTKPVFHNEWSIPS